MNLLFIKMNHSLEMSLFVVAGWHAGFHIEIICEKCLISH